MKQRLIRVLVYEGSPNWIQRCIANRGVKGSYTLPDGVIKEAIIGDFLDTLIPLDPNQEPHHDTP